MTESRADRRPPSRRIADELRAQILSGVYAPGQRLPSERELARQHGSARNTAREALGILQAEGLVVAAHGRGVFVRERPPLMRLGADRYSRSTRERTGLSPFRQEVTNQGRAPRTELRSVRRVTAPGDVAERLGLAGGGKVVARENYYFADEQPVQVGYTYLPVELAADTVLARRSRLAPGSIYTVLEELGYPVVTIREEVTARMPTPDEVAGLAMPPGVPVLELLHTSFDGGRRPFEVSRFVMRADLTGLDYRLPVTD